MFRPLKGYDQDDYPVKTIVQFVEIYLSYVSICLNYAN
jgi:hypothetical protein